MPMRFQFFGMALVLSTTFAYAAPKKAAGIAPPAGAPRIKIFTPQNLTDTVNQVKVEFSEKMVKLSQPDQESDIFTVRCTPATTGSPRWQSETVWTYDFQTPLAGNKVAGGTRCQFELKDDVKSLANKSVEGAKTFQFQVDGPNILRAQPRSEIVEDQIFVFVLDTPVDETTFLNNSYFVVQGKGHRVSAEIITGAQRDAILKASNSETGEDDKSQSVLVIKARELFPQKAKVSFVLGAGVAAKSSGITRKQVAKYEYVVRDSFSAEFSCERENPKADCIPFTGMTLSFSAPISAPAAKSISIQGPGVTRRATMGENENTTQTLKFAGPFPANAELTISVPAGLKDDAGRKLSNQNKFPLVVKTADYPPLAKFSSPFGVLESKESPLLPVTLRNLEPQMPKASALVGQSMKFNSQTFPAALKMLRKVTSRDLSQRETSALAGQPVQRFQVPLSKNGKAFEVVGIPLPGPGIYAVELQSKRLGESLLGSGKMMYVPSMALVTNMAVHLKWGRENSVIWVTSLNEGKPLAHASVSIHDCSGAKVWTGQTDANGLANYQGNIKSAVPKAECAEDKNHYSVYGSGFFVSAELGDDFSFTHTSWNQGIESWRFGRGEDSINARSPSWETEANTLTHSVFDRALVRAGETVHMKHFVRKPVGTGFANLAKDKLPSKAIIRHEGSDTTFEVAIKWDEKSFTSVSEFKLSADAMLGTYSVTLMRDKVSFEAGSFRVEEFKVPLYTGSILFSKDALIRPSSVDATLSVNYQNGGPVSGLKGTLRYFMSPNSNLRFENYEGFNFSNGGVKEGVVRNGEENTPEQKVYSQPITLDKNGTATASMTNIKVADTPQTLTAELEYRDSNGETQTVSQSKGILPSDRNIGVKIGRWVSTTKETQIQVAITDLKGRPIPAAPFSMKAYKTTHFSHRTRLVGGFYAYENITEVKETPVKWTCAQKTDAKGLATCNALITGEGQITVVAQTIDVQGNRVSANADAYVRGKDNMWFEADNNDRIDLIAEKKNYETSETARLQVRMPFQQATALVTVEREGILSAQVVTLSGKNPTVSVPIKQGYAPNVYVSTFLVRGRVAPSSDADLTATVDLGKPAYKLGLATLNVNWKAHKLNVQVSPSKDSFSPREEASVAVKVVAADGSALPAGTEVAVAVVDEGLLMLAPNRSWDLLTAMMNARPLEIETSTVQMQVIGKRHFGLKAVPHGGGGGGGGQHMTRELFDTLVYWNPSVAVDANGNAIVKFKMNDSLTKFRVVAVANAGVGQFGTGEASIVSNQNLMTTTSLPTLARTQDQFAAEFTFRNSTGAVFKGTLKGHVTFKMADGTTRTQTIPATAVEIDPKGSKTMTVAQVQVPEGAVKADYDVEILDEAGNSQDHIKVSQAIRTSNPVRTMMSSLKQVSPTETFEVQKPAQAVADLGGIKVTLTPTLASGLTTVKQYMMDYPFLSFESKFSQAVITADPKQWEAVMKLLPQQIDVQGLVKFYPNSESGNSTLTAYVISASQLGQLKLPAEQQAKMTQGLVDFVAGKVRTVKAPTAMESFSTKIVAIEALARVKAAQAGQLAALPDVSVSQMGTATLVTYLSVLNMLDNGSLKVKKDEVVAAIEARLTVNGTRYSLRNSADALWLLNSTDTNFARLILATLQSKNSAASWATKVPQLTRGLLSQNMKGTWDTTVANTYGTLALRGFSAVYEKTPVDGITQVATTQTTADHDWSRQKFGGTIAAAWTPQGHDTVTVAHKGAGAPWALVSTQAAVSLLAPLNAGFEIKKTFIPIAQKTAGRWSVGDVAEVHVKVKSNVESSQVALMDPIPAGSKIIKTGSLNSQSQTLWPAYEQTGYENYKAYYDFVPNTEFEVVYQIQFNQAGTFKMTPSRVEAVYSPENFGETPNQDVSVSPSR